MAPKKKGPAAPPIFAAIEAGKDDEFDALLKEDPALKESRNKDGWTPLIAAAYCGEMDMVESLVKAGADVRAACKDGDTAVHYASAQGHMDVITYLAKHGAKLDVKDKDGETPYNVAGKNLKVRKLIQQLMDAQLNDSSDDEGAKGGKKKGEQGEDDDEEWEEVDEEAEAEGDKAGAQQ